MPAPVIYVESIAGAKRVTAAIQDHGVIMFYYADWCGHCQRFRPAWDAFKAQVPVGAPVLVETNWDKIKLLPPAYQNIAGFPTVVFKAAGQSIEYSGDRSVGSLLQFMNGLPKVKSVAKPKAKTVAKPKVKTAAKPKPRAKTI